MPIHSISRKAFLKYLGLLGLPVPPTLNPLAANIFQPFAGSEFQFDFTLWFIRPMDLLDLEFGFSNLSLINKHISKKSQSLPAFMLVKLPHLHLAEVTHNTEETIGDSTLSNAFLSNPSYLVFKFKEENLANFNLDRDLLSWNSDRFYALTTVNEKEYPFITVNYETQGVAKGIVFNKLAQPLTTLEVPAGLPLVPFGETGTYKLDRNNIPNKPNLYSLPGRNELEIKLANRFSSFINKPYDDRSYIQAYQPYTEIWYNDLINTKKNGQLLFKVGGFNKDFTNNPYLIPNKEDKRLLYKQFIPGEKKEGEYLSREARQPAILAKQFIKGEGNFFRFTATGLSANLEYISPDEAAILQKYLHQIRFGRDIYVEVHRLMHCMPKPLRVVEVMVGERLIKNGVSYVERQKYILILDKYLTFRSEQDQDTNAMADSVLQRVTAHPQKDIVNYVRSCKRSIPFQQLEVLTEGFIPIKDFEDDINTEIASTTTNLLTKYANALTAPMAVMVGFLQECKKQREFIRANTQLKEAVGDDILELCGQSENADFIRQEFPGIVAVLPVLKDKLRKATTLMDASLAKLAADAKHLADTLDSLSDQVVKSMHDAIKDAIPEAVHRINASADAEGNKQRDIVDYRTDTYRKIRAYWPKQKSEPTKPVQFSFRYTDWNGNTGVFSCPLILVSGESVLEIGELAANKITMAAAMPAAVDKEILFEQQYCLDAIQYLTNNADRLISFGTLPAYMAEEFSGRYTELLEHVYNSVERILDGASPDEQNLYKRILELRTAKKEEFQRVSGTIKAEIESLDEKLKEKARQLWYASNVLGVFNSFKNGADTTTEQYKTIVSSLKTACNNWIGAKAASSTAWFDVNRKLNRLDQQIIRNYHSKENEYRRQIQMGQQKISYYKDKIGTEADAKIHDLTTELIEMSAIPIARMAELRVQVSALVPDATVEYNRLANFVRNFGISYTQMVTAKVLAPLYDQVTNAPSVFLSYAAPYKMAGIEAWNAANDELEKQKRNAEKILFEVRQPINIAKASVEAATDALDLFRADAIAHGNAIAIEGAATWRSFKNAAQDFETGTIGYVRGSMEDALKGAHDKLGGIMDPGVVTDQISAVKGMAYTLNNRVNIYKGAIERYSSMADSYVKSGTATLNDFKTKVKDYTLDVKSKLADQIKNIKLFSIPLDKLLKGLDTYSPKDLPEATIEIKKDGLVPIAVSANYCWSPNRSDLFADGTDVIRLINTDKKAKLSVCMNNTTSLRHPRVNSLNSSVTVSGFGISAMDIVKISFESISYTKAVITKWDTVKDDWSASSSYSHVDIKIAKVEFSGFLELVKQLQEKLGLGDGFLMDINTSGIQLSYGIRIPTIAMGGFTLSNMNLYAGMILSFQGKSPQFRFSFGERKNPFTLAVGIYAGRGFFAMNVSSEGVELLEAALEFGAYLALDLLGIAKGQAYLMAGIYFRTTRERGAYVESYITCGGCLSIIGIIQVSVVFYLSLGYQEKDKSLRGRASVEVSVKVLFFSASYNLTFEKQITGGGVSAYIPPLHEYSSYAINETAHGPNNDDEMSWAEDPIDESETVYRYLKISSETNPGKKDFVPIADPTVLYAHSMDFEKYIDQFAK